MAERVVDLRSDTVSLATERMRLAMQQAEVGDSQKREDPSVNRLQEMAAAMLGKEAAIYVPSGTMGNLAAVLAHTQPGDRAVVGESSHLYTAESDGMTRIAGVMPQVVADADGMPAPEDVERALTPRSAGRPYTTLICIENTHNKAGGAVATPEETAEIAAIARRHGAAFHIDGARIFNAAVALKIDVKELVREADSITFCISKGLSAPVGSILAGSGEFIERAEYAQHLLGGAMRQAGHMAAAGVVALEEMVDRLEEDHANARYLAEMLADLPVIKVNPARVESNLIVFDIDQERMSREQLIRALDERGVKISNSGKARARMVIYHGITRDDVEHAAAVIKEVVASA
jgi:threonine aldolase